MYSNPPMDYHLHTLSYHPWSIPPTYPTNPSFTSPTTPSFPSFPWELFTPYYTHGSSSPKLYLNHGYSPHPPHLNPSSSSPYSYDYNNYHQQLQPTNTSSTLFHEYQIHPKKRRDFDKFLHVTHPSFKKTSISTTSHYQQKPTISPPPLKPPELTLSQSPQPSEVTEETTNNALNSTFSSIRPQHTREHPFTKFSNHFPISETPKHKPSKSCADVSYEPRNTTSKFGFNSDIDSFTIRSISTLKSEPEPTPTPTPSSLLQDSISDSSLYNKIDLGTTYSCVGIWQHDRFEIIANDQGNHTTPSYVAFTDSARLVGDAAKNQVAMNATNTVFDAKRLIGRRISDSSVQSDMKLWAFKITSSPGEKPMIRVNYKGEEKVFAAKEIFEVKAFIDEEAKEEDDSDTDLHRFKDNEKYGGISLDSVWWKARFGEDSIIANLDSGIWPKHASFSGYGLMPPKQRGNGIFEIVLCITSSNATICNKKLVGARIFSKNYEARYGNFCYIFWHLSMTSPEFGKLAVQFIDKEKSELFTAVLSYLETAKQNEGALCVDSPVTIIKMLHWLLSTSSTSCSIENHIKYGEYFNRLSSQMLNQNNSMLRNIPNSSYEARLELAIQSSNIAHDPRHYSVMLVFVGYKTKDFDAQANLNPTILWVIPKSVIDLCMKLKEVELFDQMDDELGWIDDMTLYDNVPKWICDNTTEFNITVVVLSKRQLKKSLLGGSVAVYTSELGSYGFYTYAIYEHLKKWPVFDLDKYLVDSIMGSRLQLSFGENLNLDLSKKIRWYSPFKQWDPGVILEP